MRKMTVLWTLCLCLLGGLLSYGALAQQDPGRMNVPCYGQNWQPWAKEQLGFGGPGSTIGRYGCVVTSLAMLRSYYGDWKNPYDMNDWLKKHNGFWNDLVIWSAVPGYEGNYDYSRVPANLNVINYRLSLGLPVLAQTLVPPYRTQTHWVVITGRDPRNGKYYINDPLYGDRAYFNDRYGDPSRWIYGIWLYHR